MPPPLPPAFFARSALEVAPDLLGKLLVHEHADGRLAGRIVETEAYTDTDPAMHGWRAVFGSDGRVLPQGRAADLFAAPGTAYVYRVYRVHWLLNVVCQPEGVAAAVLVRAVEPTEGAERMAKRRPAARRERDLTNGPGKLTQAFDIADAAFHGTDLTAPPLYFADDGAPAPAVETSTRIGLTRGVDKPWRYVVPGNAFVSPGVPSDQRMRDRGRRAKG